MDKETMEKNLIEEIKFKSDELMVNFINNLGLDGEYFIKVAPKTPIGFYSDNGPDNGKARFISPNSEDLEEFFQINKLKPEEKKDIEENGVIDIDQSYSDNGYVSENLLITVIHERFHASRNFLVFDIFRDRQNEDAFTYNEEEEKIELNTTSYSTRNVDFSQELLKSNFDDSHEVVKKYNSKSAEEMSDIIFFDNVTHEKMRRQKAIDEALVELMALIAGRMDKYKENIWNSLEHFAAKPYSGDIGDSTIAMSKLILRHGDLDLFKWMIDPLTYTGGDIHYDFFENYANKEDDEFIQVIYEVQENEFDDMFGGLISRQDMQDAATSEVALTGLEKLTRANLDRENENNPISILGAFYKNLGLDDDLDIESKER